MFERAMKNPRKPENKVPRFSRKKKQKAIRRSPKMQMRVHDLRVRRVRFQSVRGGCRVQPDR